MKKYFLILTKYNRDVNSKVLKILEDMKEEDRIGDRKSFYGSLHGLLDHIATASLFFQKIIRSSYPEQKGLPHKYENFKLEPKKINFVEFSELKSAITTLDDAYVEMLDSLAEEDFEKPISYVSPRGTININIGALLLKHINHSTHHRGQISQILDEMNIANDFSSIADNYDS